MHCGIQHWSLGLVLGIVGLGGLCAGGCETAGQDFEEIFNFDRPTPQEAAEWMFHRDAERRRQGITLIGDAYFGGEEAYIAVYREAISDHDPMVRAVAARALGRHGEPEDAVLLAGLLRDDSQLVRWEAARGLQRLHDPRAVGRLLEAMTTDRDIDVRMAAANALGQYAEHRVLESLIGALNDPSLGVNHHARRSLRLLTGEDFGTDPGAWMRWYRAVSDPFVGRRTYHYPVYRRDPTFIERFTPFGRRVFEQPGVPTGLEEEDGAGMP